jgi:hypothetical protein
MSVVISTDEVSPEDYAGIDAVLRNIDRENQKRASLETFAQWKLAFRMYRELELQYERSINREPSAGAHRASLMSLLALTEALASRLQGIDEQDLKRISLSNDVFAGCAKLLRRKYNQWFAPVNSSLVKQFEGLFSCA